MDWTTLLYIGIFVVFLLAMMRGCGGMAAGGCGVGGRRRDQTPRDTVDRSERHRRDAA